MLYYNITFLFDSWSIHHQPHKLQQNIIINVSVFILEMFG